VTVERGLRALAGIVTLASLALAHWVSPNWLWVTAFAGLNLLQSAFTNWCPAMPVLRALGFRQNAPGCCLGSSPDPSPDRKSKHI
jgi:hypothetical protein